MDHGNMHPLTQTRLMLWQSQHYSLKGTKLPADGVVDAEDWAKLRVV
jgi:hypothetical protein